MPSYNSVLEGWLAAPQCICWVADRITVDQFASVKTTIHWQLPILAIPVVDISLFMRVWEAITAVCWVNRLLHFVVIPVSNFNLNFIITDPVKTGSRIIQACFSVHHASFRLLAGRFGYNVSRIYQTFKGSSQSLSYWCFTVIFFVFKLLKIFSLNMYQSSFWAGMIVIFYSPLIDYELFDKIFYFRWQMINNEITENSQSSAKGSNHPSQVGG